MDPVQQTLAQQQSGSAEGQGFGSFFTQGMQFGLEKQRLDIEKAQEKRATESFNALAPYLKSNAQNQAAIIGQHAVSAQRENQIAAESNNALPDILELRYKFMTSPLGFKDPALHAEFHYLKDHYPLAFVPGGPGDKLFNEIAMPSVIDQKWNKLLEMQQDLQDRGLDNIFVHGFDAHGNPTVSPNTAPLAEERIVNERNRLDSLNKDRDRRYELAQRREKLMEQDRTIRNDLSAKRIGNEEARLRLEQVGMGLRQIDQQLKATEQGFEIVGQPSIPNVLPPSGGVPSGLPPMPEADSSAQTNAPVQFRPIERPATTGTVTDLQKHATQLDGAIPLLDRAFDALDKVPQAFGPLGALNAAGERLKGVMDPNAATTITKARAEADIAFTKLAPTLRMDSGNMSRYERSRLEGLGDALDWTKPAPVVQAQLRNLYDASIAQRLRIHKQLKSKPADELLSRIAADQLPELYRDNLLNEADAKRWKELHQTR